MEPQRRLIFRKWTWLGWVCFALVIVACDSTETPGETSNAAPGVDPFCDTRPKIDFCEDFDTTDLPGAFDEQRVDAGTMTLSSEEASSAPHSLLVAVEAGGYGQLRQTFESGGKLRLFGMFFIAELGEGDVEIGAFEVGDYRIGFGASEDGTVWAYEGDERLVGEGSLPLGKWSSFRWDVNLYDDGTGNAKLRFGNDVIVETEELTTPIGSEDAPICAVGLSAATGSWAMHFDNLTVAIEEAVQ